MDIYFCYNVNMEFNPDKFISWINEKYDTWRYGKPRVKKTDYAKYVGVSSQVMSNWLLGNIKKRPSEDSWQKLLRYYGNEVYNALGLPVPTPLKSSLSELALSLSSDEFNRFAEVYKEFNDEISQRGIDKHSPEAKEIINSSLERHGFIDIILPED